MNGWLRRASVLTLCAMATGRAEEIKRMEPLLGTYVEITARGPDKDAMQRAVDAGFDAFRQVDRLISSYRDDSEVSRINAHAGRGPVSVSPWTFECLKKAVEVGERSGGAFDITCRPLLDLWGFLKKEYRVPTEFELRFARDLVDYRRLELVGWPAGRSGAARRTAFLRQSGMTLDLGGIGKGFAVDKAVAALKAAGVDAGRVRAWGDCFGFGARDWTVEIEPGKTVVLRNEAASTSGDYENFFEKGGRHYAHIVDPKTGVPVEGIRSVTVKARTCTESDAWATAIYVNPALKPRGIQVVYLERK